jgi:hypothetical protein
MGAIRDLLSQVPLWDMRGPAAAVDHYGFPPARSAVPGSLPVRFSRPLA